MTARDHDTSPQYGPATPRGGGGDSTHVRLLGSGRGAAAWAGTWRGGVGLVVVCLLVLVPGLWQLPPFDRDEPRFAQASRQMLASGDWVVPFVQDRPRLNKPPLIYWAQAGTVWALTGGGEGVGDVREGGLRDPIWMYRVAGMMCTMLAVLLTWRLGRELVDARAAWLGAALLAICPLVVFDAHQARSDQLLLATVVASQWALWRVLRAEHVGTAGWLGRCVVLGACLGVGVLAKGPIAPMVAGLTALAFVVVRSGDERAGDRSRRIGPMLGLAGVVLVAGVCVMMVLPWVWAVASRVGWDQYLALIHDETLGRAVEPKEGHAMFPGFHLVALVALFFPGSMLAGAAVVGVLRAGVWRARPWWRGREADLFLLAWLLPAWLIFELISTRLAHYVMPLYPALALLTARVVLRVSGGGVPLLRDRLTRAGLVIWTLVGVAMVAGAPVALGVLAHKTHQPGWMLALAIACGVVGAGLCIAAGVFAFRGKVLRGHLLASCALVGTLGVLLSVLLPGNAQLWPARNAIAAVRSIDPGLERPLAAVGFHEDSQIFLSGGAVQRIDADEFDAWASTHPRGLVILRRGDASSLGLGDAPVLASAGGFNLNRGKWEDLIVVQAVSSGGGP